MGRRIKAGIRITPQRFAAQWEHLHSKFAVNVWNFEVRAAKEAVIIFKESFNIGRMNTAGSRPWKKRRRVYSHPILRETSTLRNSISYKNIGNRGRSISSFFGSGKNGVRIFTDPTKFGTAAKHKGFCYAAIHNDTDGKHLYGNSGVPSVQRQFMGDSTVLERKLKDLSKVIFEGFPR